MTDVPNDQSHNPMEDHGPIPPREQLVKTAAKFLSSQNVVNSSEDSKIAFLKKKGLSDAEIDLAMKQADVIIQSRSFKTNPLQPINAIQPYPVYWQQQPSWMRYRDIANSVALIGGFAYVAYWFYKKYLGPFLFGGSKKSLDTRLCDLDKMISDSVTDLKSSVTRMRDDMERVTERRIEFLSRQIDELKNEVSSLKKLMLSRKQFPTATVPGPLAIPPWQLAAAAEEKEAEEEGGGSGTNGSDSSLEMIKE